MTFQSVPDCAEVVIQGSIAGQGVANVVNFHQPGGYNQASIDALAAAADAWVGANYLPIFANSVTYLQCLVRGLQSVIDLTGTNGTNTGPGTLAGSGMPANATLCVTLRTGFTGRSARGRFYVWPFASSVLVTSQTVSPTYASNCAAALLQLRSDAQAIGWEMSIVSRRTLGALRPVGIATHVTSIVSRNDEVDSQRHRLLRGH